MALTTNYRRLHGDCVNPGYPKFCKRCRSRSSPCPYHGGKREGAIPLADVTRHGVYRDEVKERDFRMRQFLDGNRPEHSRDEKGRHYGYVGDPVIDL